MIRNLSRVFAAGMFAAAVLFAVATVALVISVFGIPAAGLTALGAYVCYICGRVCWNIELVDHG